jgi:hypothetical protein
MERSNASGLSGRFTLPIAVLPANADIFQELLRQHVVHRVLRDIA